jgi:hypothetical protein
VKLISWVHEIEIVNSWILYVEIMKWWSWNCKFVTMNVLIWKKVEMSQSIICKWIIFGIWYKIYIIILLLLNKLYLLSSQYVHEFRMSIFSCFRTDIYIFILFLYVVCIYLTDLSLLQRLYDVTPSVKYLDFFYLLNELNRIYRLYFYVLKEIINPGNIT